MNLKSRIIKIFLKGLVLITVAAALPLVVAGQAESVTLIPGDIIVSDQDISAIIQIDPATGNQTIISSGGLLSSPRGIALDPHGNILVTVRFGAVNGVLRVDPTTGTQTVVSSEGNFVAPAALVLDANNDILVADFSGSVIKVDPLTGAQTVISSGGSLITPTGIVIDANDDILVSDFDVFGVGPGKVVHVNPMTGAQTIVSSDWNFLNPTGITIGADSDIFVTNQGYYPGGVNNIIRVNPVTGEQIVVFSSSSILPVAIAPDANGDILVADFFGGITRIDPSTGSYTVVSSHGSLISPAGIAIMPEPSVSTVSIDIKTGSLQNSINLRSRSAVWVAILTTGTFDAITVDPATVFFGRTGTEASPVQYALEDADGDGDTDIILQFKTSDTGLKCGDTTASLIGFISIKEIIKGSDSVNIAGCK